MLVLSCPSDGRSLKHTITRLLKSGIASHVRTINYAKSYTLKDKSIEKKQEKLLLIDLALGREDAFEHFLKEHPNYTLLDL